MLYHVATIDISFCRSPPSLSLRWHHPLQNPLMASTEVFMVHSVTGHQPEHRGCSCIWENAEKISWRSGIKKGPGQDPNSKCKSWKERVFCFVIILINIKCNSAEQTIQSFQCLMMRCIPYWHCIYVPKDKLVPSNLCVTDSCFHTCSFSHWNLVSSQLIIISFILILLGASVDWNYTHEIDH